jgi:hypothetical protein
VYARILGLRHLRPGTIVCFLFFEGSIAVGFLLTLAELTSWLAVVVIPVTVAAMVKVNDVVAGALSADPAGDPCGRHGPQTRTAPAAGRGSPD